MHQETMVKALFTIQSGIQVLTACAHQTAITKVVALKQRNDHRLLRTFTMQYPACMLLSFMQFKQLS